MKKNGKRMTAVALAMVIGLSYTGYPVHAQEETEINPPATVEDVAEQEQDDSPDETETATEKNEITENENLTENEELSANANAVTAGTEALGKITTYAENNAGSFHVTGGTAETDWTYDSDENTLTFNNSGTYTITGDGQETAERIIVSDNFNGTITIENINIRSNCAFEVKNTATLTLMLVGNNTLTSTGSAGLLFENATTGKLIIDSDTAGSLTTTSSWISAGIGGGDRASGNNITINGGTVTATSSEGAGIGDGCGAYFYGSGSNITITGGSVKASSISPTPTDGKGNNVYLARIDNLSGVHSVTVDNATYTRAGDHPDDGAFYLYLTGEAHTIEVNGKSTSIQWDSDNSRFVTSDSEFINLPLEISSTAINADWFYDINDRTFNLLSGNDYTITGGGTEVNCRIIVADNFSGTVTLENVNINGTGEIVSLGENTHLTLKFNGENNLSTTGQVAAISTTYESSSLTFDSDTNGILNVTASSGVAIGGWSNTYNITFNGGTINASGYTYQQSDIGVPLYGNGTTAKNIVVNGGTVNCLKSALGNSYGGNKFYSCGCQITINGGTVTAPCIGGSTNTENTKVTINGGSVKGKIQTYGTLTDSNNNVYLVKLDNLSGVNEVTVDGTTTYTRNSDHPDDGAFYLYLTGENHIITTTKGDYTAQWISDSNSFKVSAPKPTVTIQSKTATSITVQPLADIDTYGEAEYRINNTDWQSSNVFTELAANTEYTVHARYKGNESYLQSEAESTTVTTMKDGNTLINAEKPTGLTGVYGQKLSDVSLADTDWTWSNGETALAVNTISYSARFNTTDYENEYDFSNVSGYNSSSHYVEIDLTVTVSQATNEWTSELSIADWTYGQAASTPTATARYGNVVFAYSDSENGTFATDVPTESGTWYVKATVAGTADYTGLEAVTNFEIKKADSTISFNEGVSIGKEYNGEAVEITADDVTKTGSTNDVDFSWQQKEDDDWTDLTFAPVNAGSYRVIASVKEDRNFKGASATIEFAISQTTNEWTSELSIEDWTYGQKASTPTATAQYGDVTFTYSDKKDGTYTDTVPTDAGTWYVKASVAGNENYTGLEAVKKFNIGKANSSITFKDGFSLNKVYDTQPVTVSEENIETTGSTGKVDFSYEKKVSDTWEPLSEAPANAGTYRVTATLTGDNNYNSAASKDLEFTIAKAGSSLVITTDNMDKSYDGQTVSNPDVEKEGTTNTVTFTWYKKDGNRWTELNEAPVNAGNYKVVAAVQGDDNYNGTETEKTFEITKAMPTYTVPEDLIIKQGEVLSTVTLPDGFAWNNSTQPADDLGTQIFKATFTPADTTNYQTVEVDIRIEVVPAVSTINRMPEITAEDKILTVGDTFDPKKDVTATDKEDGDVTDKIEVIKNNVDTAEAGTYEVTYKVTDSEGASSAKTIAVTVNPKMETLNEIPMITAEDKILTVGDTFDPKKDVTAMDKEDGDVTDKIEVISNNVDTSKAGIYEVIYKVTDSQGASTTKTVIVTVREKINSQILDKGNDRTGNKTDKLSQSDKIQKAVKTGDTNIVNIVLWSALSFISVIGVLLTILFRRRRH